MELFDTHFVQFGQVLPVSGLKLLAISNRYVQVVKSQPYLDYFHNTHSKIKTNIRLSMYKSTLFPTGWLFASFPVLSPDFILYQYHLYLGEVWGHPLYLAAISGGGVRSSFLSCSSIWGRCEVIFFILQQYLGEVWVLNTINGCILNLSYWTSFIP